MGKKPCFQEKLHLSDQGQLRTGASQPELHLAKEIQKHNGKMFISHVKEKKEKWGGYIIMMR